MAYTFAQLRSAMPRLLFLLIASAITFSGCGTPKPDFSYASPQEKKQLEEAVASHDRLAATLARCRSSSAEIFEGLPHPRWEKQTLEVESRRSDTFRNHDFGFYRPAMTLPQSARSLLLARVQSATTYQPWSGPKLCGGFHPDLLVRFRTDSGPIDIHLCFGCSEAMIFDGSSFILVDMTDTISDTFQQLQETHRDKRPAKQRPF